MTISQINLRIQDLETWLIQNPNNKERNIIESDLKKLYTNRECKAQIVNRIKILYLSLKFCSKQRKTFTIGERICINQERFQLINILSKPEEKPRPVSKIIETKINEIIKLIQTHHFELSVEDPIDYETENEQF